MASSSSTSFNVFLKSVSSRSAALLIRGVWVRAYVCFKLPCSFSMRNDTKFKYFYFYLQSRKCMFLRRKNEYIRWRSVGRVITSSACQCPYSFSSFSFSRQQRKGWRHFMLLAARRIVVDGNFTQKILREIFFPPASPSRKPRNIKENGWPYDMGM